MVRFLFCAAALAFTIPVAAQTATDTQPPGAAESQKPAATGDAVASIVDNEFPAYDQNNDGQLDKAEFARWMVALKQQEMKSTGKVLAPADIAAWTEGAFTTADADKSGSVSKPELITYLSGGAV